MVPSRTFDPLREKLGGADSLREFLAHKIRVVDGDITEENLGLSEEQAAQVAADISVVINSSGKVTFNPPLESALRTNVQGTKNVIAFVKRMRRPALIHTSTCFVAGNRSGNVWESEPLDGYFPRREELAGTRFSVEQEIADCGRIATEVRAQADDAQVVAQMRQRAREALLEQHRDPDDEAALKLAVARERKDWVRAELTAAGNRARQGLGLAQHLHLHQEHGATSWWRVKPASRDPSYGRPSWKARWSIRSAAGTRASPPRRLWCTWRSRARTSAGVRVAHPRRGAGRLHRGRRADGGGPGMRGGAGAGAPVGGRRPQPLVHRTGDHADRAVQTSGVSRTRRQATSSSTNWPHAWNSGR